LKYFELVFLQLELVKISRKLIIIGVNYERKKKEWFFVKHHVHNTQYAMAANRTYQCCICGDKYCSCPVPTAPIMTTS